MKLNDVLLNVQMECPLRKCPQSLKHLRRCLDSLPKSLDATYERMLREIPEEVKEEAKRILILLCFSYRPLTVFEVMSALAVDISDQECYDHDLKLEQPEDLLRICPGLIDIVPSSQLWVTSKLSNWHWLNRPCGRRHCLFHDRYSDPGRLATVRISHFSVQEYLLSDRIMQNPATFFGISKRGGHFEISKTCLIYLCSQSFLSQQYRSSEYPLSMYAAEYWYDHFLEDGVGWSSDLDRLALHLFSNRKSVARWRRLHNGRSLLSRAWASPEPDLRLWSPVFDAALLGLYDVLVELLAISPQDVHAQEGSYTALQAAVERGNIEVVQLLLDRGADVNARQGKQRTPLYLAVCSDGPEQLVQLLLDHGADVHAYTGDYISTVLCQAAGGSHESMVKLLLDHGADVNASSCNVSPTALCEAAKNGQLITVRLLLDNGADVNACVPYGQSVLESAIRDKHSRIVKILLDHGANTNVVTEPYNTEVLDMIYKWECT